MVTRTEKAAYEKYLTKRLDNGQSQNVVISTTTKLLTRMVEENGGASVLDIGCYSGAMLNRIRRELPVEVSKQIQFTGADIDEEILEIGRRKYQNLDLKPVDLRTPVDHLGTYDVVILANIIHEILPENPNVETKFVEHEVAKTLSKVSDLLTINGNLVILDGIKPANENLWINIDFSDSEVKNLFIEFSQKYQAFPVRMEEVNGIFRTRMKDLAAFLTKARYLKEKYWPIETTQNYQYFSMEQFRRTIGDCGMTIRNFEPQRFSEEHLKSLIRSINPVVEAPVKNVLIVADKTN
jgi:SAM-dependent methyltransferase